MLLGRFITLLGMTLLPLAHSVAATTPTAPSTSPPLDPAVAHAARIHEQSFVQEMVAKHHFKTRMLTHLLHSAKFNPDVIARITHPFEKKPWDFYQQHFVTEKRVHDGAHYWSSHTKSLQYSQRHYQVDPSIVISIIGVESAYGHNTGSYPELSTLKTLAFYFPPRANFFRKELELFLLLTRKHQLPALGIKGSYAGALGIPQFMPSSYNHYGVNFNLKPRVNLFTDHRDAIASISNYLKTEGWQWGQPVAVPAIIHGLVPRRLLSTSARPKYTLAQLSRFGVHTKTPLKYSGKVALIALEKTHGKEYWITFPNFRSIMNYNPSTSYAMGVYQLSQAIQKAHTLPQSVAQSHTANRTAHKTAHRISTQRA